MPLIITVLPKTPTLTVNPSDLTLAKTTKVTLTCHTDSLGTVTYLFYVNETNKKLSPKTASPDTIIFDQIETTHSGSYTCVAIIDGHESHKSLQQDITVVGKS